MNNLFNYDGKFVSSVNKAIDAFVLGFFWLICSVPVFTAGAASAAFYYAFHKSVRLGNGYPIKEFFRGFKSNFKQATALWLILMFLTLVLCLDLYILTSDVLQIGMLQPFLIVTSFLILAICAMWGLCAFPYMSRFACTMKDVLKNSFIVTLANLHWALLLLVLLAGAIAIFFTVPVLSLLTPAIYMFLANRILERVFQRHMRPEDLKAQKEAEAQA